MVFRIIEASRCWSHGGGHSVIGASVIGVVGVVYGPADGKGRSKYMNPGCGSVVSEASGANSVRWTPIFPTAPQRRRVTALAKEIPLQYACSRLTKDRTRAAIPTPYQTRPHEDDRCAEAHFQQLTQRRQCNSAGDGFLLFAARSSDMQSLWWWCLKS
jgi:hypothetical protein